MENAATLTWWVFHHVPKMNAMMDMFLPVLDVVAMENATFSVVIVMVAVDQDLTWYLCIWITRTFIVYFEAENAPDLGNKCCAKKVIEGVTYNLYRSKVKVNVQCTDGCVYRKEKN